MHLTYRRHLSHDGFSLSELIIVIAIIGILLAIATPVLLSWLPEIRLNSATRDLYGALSRARLEAARQGKNCVVIFRNNSYQVFVDSNSDKKLDAGETILVTQTLAADVTFGDESGGSGLTFAKNGDNLPYIAFKPDMLPINMGSACLLSDSEHLKRVPVNITGNIRIQTYDPKSKKYLPE